MKKTVENAMKEWLNIYIKPCCKNTTYDSYLCCIKIMLIFKPEFQTMFLDQLHEEDIQNLLNDIGYEYSKSTIRKMIIILKNAYKKGNKNKWCRSNPATDLTVPAYASEKEVPALSVFQQQRVEAAAADDPLGDLVLFLLKSGLRAGELMNLKWDDYSKRYQELKIRTSKTKAGIRILPLTSTLIEIIERQSRLCDYIFTNTHGNPITKSSLRKLYLRIRKKTGIDFFTNHVCRHTFATRMIEQTADPKAVSILLGHTDVTFTLNRYTHPDQEYLHDQMQLIEHEPEINSSSVSQMISRSSSPASKNELQLLLASLLNTGTLIPPVSNKQTITLQLQIPLPSCGLYPPAHASQEQRTLHRRN